MMSSNESITGRGSPKDASACMTGDEFRVLDSVRGRLEWIDERVNEAHQLAGTNSLARAICATVDEFAELLRVHYAGGE